jgi:hypothetical protein
LNPGPSLPPKPLSQLLPLQPSPKSIAPLDELTIPKVSVRAAVVRPPAFNPGAPIESASSLPSIPPIGAFVGALVLAAFATGAGPSPVLDLPFGRFECFRFLLVDSGGHSLSGLARFGSAWAFLCFPPLFAESKLCASRGKGVKGLNSGLTQRPSNGLG